MTLRNKVNACRRTRSLDSSHCPLPCRISILNASHLFSGDTLSCSLHNAGNSFDDHRFNEAFEKLRCRPVCHSLFFSRVFPGCHPDTLATVRFQPASEDDDGGGGGEIKCIFKRCACSIEFLKEHRPPSSSSLSSLGTFSFGGVAGESSTSVSSFSHREERAACEKCPIPYTY